MDLQKATDRFNAVNKYCEENKVSIQEGCIKTGISNPSYYKYKKLISGEYPQTGIKHNYPATRKNSRQSKTIVAEAIPTQTSAKKIICFIASVDEIKEILKL